MQFCSRINLLRYFLLVNLSVVVFSGSFAISGHAYAQTRLETLPTVNDPNLKVELVSEGLRLPTNMAFLGPSDILVLEKNEGTVRRIVNGSLLEKPLLDVPVAVADERGMLGIAISNDQNDTRVFLYYTESRGTAAEGSADDPNNVIGNRLYRYSLKGDTLVEPKLLLEIPPLPATHHNGGELLVGPDNNIYVVVGDAQDPGQIPRSHVTTAQNVPDALYPDGTSGILRITQDGQPIKNIIGGRTPTDKYYAYGIRNSFGMDFDPVTGKLWDSENGPDFGDEINLVEPGFNSGWRIVQGFSDSERFDENDLVAFPGLSANSGSIVGIAESFIFRLMGLGGRYSDPEFEWGDPVAPTAIKFLNSSSLGSEYQNNLFVASLNYGSIYRFQLNEARTGFILEGQLADMVANDPEDNESLVFASGFGRITDIQVGPDGYLYVLAFAPADGKIFRIAPR